MITLTPEQQKAAYTLGKNICVVAGAGTGKTAVLVERVLKLVENGVNANDILAITFTERAAAEMSERIIKRLPNDSDPSQISTIHGFCLKLLQQFSKQAGYERSLTVISPTQSRLIAGDSIEEVVFTWQRQRSEDLKLLMADIAWGVGVDAKRSLIDVLLPLHSKLRALGWQPGLDLYKPVTDQEFQREVKQTVSASTNFLTELGAHKRASDLSAAIEQLTSTSLQDMSAIEQGLLVLQKALGGRWPNHVIETKNAVREQIENGLANVRQVMVEQAFKLLGEFLTEFDASYTENLRAKNWVDFDQLQVAALHLLTNDSDVCKQVRQRYPYVLVDEFQDVSPIQRKIIEAVQSPDQLFLVGDVRQSIYSFRYADVKGFDALRMQLSKNNGLSVALTSNFRSTAGLIEFANDFIEANKKYLAEGCEVGPSLVPGAQKQPDVLSSTELHIIHAENAEEALRLEAMQIAERLTQLVQKQEVEIEVDGDVRPATWGDIAVLCRHRASMQVIEHRLRERDIAVDAVAAGGFYQVREVQDTLNVLRLMIDPSDNARFAWLLKSTYVGIDDQELYDLFAGSKKAEQDLFAYLQHAKNLHERTKSLLNWFLPIYKQRDLLTVYPLLESIVQMSRVEPRLLAQDQQAIANVDKLLQLAIEWDQQGSGGVVDFLRMTDMMLESGNVEPQADVVKPGGQVRLMTVHAAKGLEFPIVVLPDLRRSGARVLPPIVCDRDLNVGVRMWRVQGSVLPRSYVEAAANITRTQVAEEGRVLYVGLTRARSKLILTSGSNGKETGWLKILGRQFDLKDLVSKPPQDVEHKKVSSFSGRTHLDVTIYPR